MVAARRIWEKDYVIRVIRMIVGDPKQERRVAFNGSMSLGIVQA
jgi:hypothetical protein